MNIKKPYINDRSIYKKVKELSVDIISNIKTIKSKGDVLAVGVLNGSVHFFSDLTRQLNNDGLDVMVDFVATESYHNNKKSDSLRLLYEPKIDIKDKTIILIEDIADSGDTIKMLRSHFESKGANCVIVVTLLKRHSCPITVDFYGFLLQDDAYVVGYGLDDNRYGRNSNYIYKIN